MLLLITSGRGPAECEHAVTNITKKIICELEDQHATVTLVEAQEGYNANTNSSILLSVTGLDAYCNGLCGTFQWIGQSPYRPNHKRKNWFIGVSSILEPEAMPELDPKNLTFTTMKSSGPGGQHVNKTESAVRVIHNPTGLTATSQEERSQHQNKRIALMKLARLFYDRHNQELKEADVEKWNNHNNLERGNAVRIYEGEKFKLR